MTFIQTIWRSYLRIKNPTCTIRAASLSRNVHFEKGVTVEYGSHIQADRIGKYSYVNKYCLIEKNTVIGRFCSIAYNVKIGLGSHPTDWVSTHPFAYDSKYKFVRESKSFQSNVKKKTMVGNDVWIGANAIVLAGITIGDGAIIGANSLVTKDVEPYSIVFGIPAEFQRFRFKEQIIDELLKSKWWNWEDDKIIKNVDLFSDPDKLVAFLKNPSL